jgi:hypothetical protein
MAAYLSKQGLGQQVEYWNEPPNYRLKLPAGLFLAERPLLKRSVRCSY